jgi:hypothetical protein
MKMATEQTFEDLLCDAPETPAIGTISLVGVLERSSDAAKFVLKLQNGMAVTLETAAVKGHALLGKSTGQVVVRVDIDPAKAPGLGHYQPTPQPWLRRFEPQPSPWISRDDPVPVPWVTSQGGATPFSLATPRQAPEVIRLGKPPTFDGLSNPYLQDIKNADDGTNTRDLYGTASHYDIGYGGGPYSAY